MHMKPRNEKCSGSNILAINQFDQLTMKCILRAFCVYLSSYLSISIWFYLSSQHIQYSTYTTHLLYIRIRFWDCELFVCCLLSPAPLHLLLLLSPAVLVILLNDVLFTDAYVSVVVVVKGSKIMMCMVCNHQKWCTQNGVPAILFTKWIGPIWIDYYFHSNLINNLIGIGVYQ